MTRREFTAVAVSTVASAAVRPIRVAVIGTGHGHAQSKIRALRSMPEYELVEQLSPEQVEADASIELVALESGDPDENLAFAERFARARRYIHFDKPPGSDLGRLRSVLNEAARHNRVVQIGYQWRYHPAMQAAIDAARKGWLGRVYRFRASIDKLIGPEERNHLARYPGGLMFSEGCHLIDRAVDLLGKPPRATGFLQRSGELADNTVAILEYPSALAEISMAGFHERGSLYRFLEIQGTNGFARVQPYTFPSRLTVDLAREAGLYKSGAQTIEVAAPPKLAYTPDFREMAAIIRDGARPTYTPEHDLIVHETLLRVCGMLNG